MNGDLGGFPLSSHLRMLQDRGRLRAYWLAMKEVIEPGMTVVDIGTGSGVLAFMAHRLGAGRVVGIDNCDLLVHAKRTAKDNFPGAKIRFVKCDVLHDPLPDVKADVIVCELLGPFGVGEEIRLALKKACRHLLKRGGRVIPYELELFGVPVACPALARSLDSWNRPIAGVDFGAFREFASNHVYLRDRERVELLGRAQALGSFGMGRGDRSREPIGGEMQIQRTGQLDGVMGFFDAKLSPSIRLSNDPDSKSTHWGQVLFPIGGALPDRVVRGDRVSFAIDMRTRNSVKRWTWKVGLATKGRTRSLEMKADEWL